MFNPDVGSGRGDFPHGDAPEHFHSMKRLLALPPETRLYTHHDHPPSSEYTSVGEQEKKNKHIKSDSSEDDFVKWRSQREKMSEPKLVHQAM
ncbi:hypothetical protein N7537_003729 [Penicillium hordei]|uniref:Uncharacterized protein n=1 Tax=Penicillium hordei TaxID=40994 RepID=A0AAD6H5H7_9EURO|nr:uncharacterized protein N7537_003729 [Penicillium hordei]KAJ5607110.1 hypothetical protein N7537_003729 [Penicillium hordei]